MDPLGGGGSNPLLQLPSTTIKQKKFKKILFNITRSNCALDRRAMFCLYVPEFQRQVFKRRSDIWPRTIQPIQNLDNSVESIQTNQKIQTVFQNARFERKNSELELFLGLRSSVGELRALHHFAPITGS